MCTRTTTQTANTKTHTTHKQQQHKTERNTKSKLTQKQRLTKQNKTKTNTETPQRNKNQQYEMIYYNAQKHECSNTHARNNQTTQIKKTTNITKLAKNNATNN